MAYAIKKAKLLLIGKEIIGKAKPPVTQTETVEKPYRSKLMVCIEVLCTLVSAGPLTLTQLSHTIQLDKTRLISHLKLLNNRALVEKQTFGEDQIFYVVTERGTKVLKIISPIIREAHKIQMRDFEAISSTLSGAGYY